MSVLRSLVLCALVAVSLVGCGGGGGGGGGDAPPAGGGETTNPPPTVVAPAITSQPESQTVNDGDAVRFIVAASGTTPFSIQWKRNDVDIPGATSAFYDIAAVSMSDSGAEFSAVISNSAGSATSAAAMVTVTPVSPIITGAPQDQTVIAGSTASFSVQAAGTGPLSFQWRRNSVPIQGATSSTYSITNVQFNIDSGAAFDVTVSSLHGAVSSAPVYLTVAPVAGAVTIDNQPSNISVTEGASATFSVTTSGAGPLSYRWKRNGQILSGVYGPSYTFAPVTRFNNGDTFQVEVSNGLGLAVSNSASLTVAQGALSLIAGSLGGKGNLDGSGGLARFWAAVAVATDKAGNTYVADYNNHTIRKISSSGVTTTLAGTAGVYGSFDGPGSVATFTNPAGIAVDENGLVYVADGSNHTIRRIDAGGFVTTLAGSPGLSGSIDGNGSSARFNMSNGIPIGMALDNASNIYLADSGNHTIRKISPSADVTTIAGSAGVAGMVDDIALQARFNTPRGLALDSAGNVYIADYGNHKIRKLATDGAVTSVNAPTTRNTAGTYFINGLFAPNGVAVDASDNVFWSNEFTPFVSKLTGGSYDELIAGGQSSIPPHTDGIEIQSSFTQAGGLAVTPAGDVLVADFFAIRRITAKKEVSTLAGNNGFVVGYADGPVTSAKFGFITAAVSDGTGGFHITDGNYGLIRHLAANDSVSTFAGSGQHGFADGSGTSASFALLSDIERDSSGNLYVADIINHDVRKITPTGVVSRIAGSTSGVSGSLDGAGTSARFYRPTGLAVAASGDIFVADSWNHTIRKIAADGTVTTIAGTAGVFGTANGIGAAANFWNPSDIAIDSSGNLFISDTGNHCIRKIAPGNLVTTFAGSCGYADAIDNNGSVARLNQPRGIAIDSNDNLYVADSGNHTIRKINTAGDVTTVVGSASTSGVRLGALMGSLTAPLRVSVMSSGPSVRLIITDENAVLSATLP